MRRASPPKHGAVRTPRAARPNTTLQLEALEDRLLLQAGLSLEPPDALPPVPTVARLPTPQPAAAATTAVPAVPAYASLPGARATLYLDFNGHFERTWGTYSNL